LAQQKIELLLQHMAKVTAEVTGEEEELPGTNGRQNNGGALVTVLTVALSCSLGYARKRIRPPDPEKTHTHTHTRKKERKQESKKARKQIVR
jgi:hypothetical protein